MDIVIDGFSASELQLLQKALEHEIIRLQQNVTLSPWFMGKLKDLEQLKERIRVFLSESKSGEIE